MTDGRDDELLDRLRRANPAAGTAGPTTDSARAGALSLPPRRPWRPSTGGQPADIRDEPLDRALHAADPAPHATADLRAEQHAAELFAFLTTGGARRHHRIVRGRRGIAVLIVAATCIAASAFGYVFAQRNVTYSATVLCFASDSLTASSVGLNDNGTGAIATCRDAVWSKGDFGTPSTPALVGCVLAGGAEGVFPGRSSAVCTALDLSSALPPTGAARRFARLQQLLITDLDPDNRCLSTAAARRVVLADMARTGVTGWAVKVGKGTSAGRPCTQPLVDTSPHEIVLVPFPRLVDHRPVAPTGSRG